MIFGVFIYIISCIVVIGTVFWNILAQLYTTGCFEFFNMINSSEIVLIYSLLGIVIGLMIIGGKK